ncbi:2586_t:CDS:2, partial [Rhizophagus irregularis]
KLPVFSICCAKGKVILPFLQELPLPLNTLLTGTDPRLCTFRQNIRILREFFYLKFRVGNTIVNFSVPIFFEREDNFLDNLLNLFVKFAHLLNIYHLHGEMYHRIGSLSPNSETQPQFAQIYIYDTDHEIQNKLNIMPGLDPMILGELQQMLHDINPYVNQF